MRELYIFPTLLSYIVFIYFTNRYLRYLGLDYIEDKLKKLYNQFKRKNVPYNSKL